MDLTKYHPTVTKITSLLEKASAWHEVFEHEPVRTSEQAAQVRPGYTMQQGAKAIILRVKQAQVGKFFVMLVLPGDKRFDAKKVKDLLETQDIRFATEEEVVKITNGILPGGVPPFGNLFSLKVYADTQLLQNEKIIFNAGDRSVSVAMRSLDYIKLVSPLLADIT